jgi:hypothetical protein
VTRRPLLLALLLLGAMLRARAAEEDETSYQNIIVRPGDTLWGIAHTYLKDPARWDEIVKRNRLPTSDPTVALPGMTLRVPVKLIKSTLRAAHLVYGINRVLFRRRDTADWKGSKAQMELYQGDTLRTLEDSRARVKFLNKELLSLEPDSMAVIKPVEDAEADIVLKSGSVFTGHARVVTASARVTPRTLETRYSASIEPDLTTRVEVFKGVAAVEAQGSEVDVAAGMQTRVRPGLAPEVPRRLENAPALEVRAQEFASAAAVGGGTAPNPRGSEAMPVPSADAATLRGDIDSLSVGVPILGFHVQTSVDREFKKLVFDRKYENDERFSPADANLAPGAYWWRIAVVDLLGTEGTYSEPRYYTVGVKRAARAPGAELGELLTIMSPESGAVLTSDTVRVVGVLRDDTLTLEIGGKPVRIDADGNFVAVIPLQDGVNEIEVVVSDGKGNVTRVSRRVTRR